MSTKCSEESCGPCNSQPCAIWERISTSQASTVLSANAMIVLEAWVRMQSCVQRVNRIHPCGLLCWQWWWPRLVTCCGPDLTCCGCSMIHVHKDGPRPGMFYLVFQIVMFFSKVKCRAKKPRIASSEAWRLRCPLWWSCNSCAVWLSACRPPDAVSRSFNSAVYPEFLVRRSFFISKLNGSMHTCPDLTLWCKRLFCIIWNHLFLRTQ